MKKRHICILYFAVSFLMPMLIFALAWARYGITYNGEMTPLVYDAATQYMPFLSGLRYLFNGDSSLFFNWACDFGGDYYSLFTYYLSSPLNLLTLFWPLIEMANAYYVLTLIKIGLCGLSFCIFLKYGLQEDADEIRWINLSFVCCYALSAYMFEYASCIMWLDTLVVLPICLLFTKDIVNGKISARYILSVAALIIVNFYMAFAAGIFVFLYFLYNLMLQERVDKKTPIRKIGAFMSHSILGVLITMPLVLPTVLRLIEGIKIGSIFEETSFSSARSVELSDVVLNMLPQHYNPLRDATLPNVFCGSIVVILCLLYYILRGNRREKAASVLLWLPIGLGFGIPLFNVFWHGFQEPHAYPYRYAYLFSTAIIIIASKALSNPILKEFIYKNKLAAIIVCCYTFIELMFNGTVITARIDEEQGYIDRNVYLATFHEYDSIETIVSELQENAQFYRIGDEYGCQTNNAALRHGYKGTSYFSSSYNHYLNDTLIALGTDSLHRLSVSGSLSWPLKSVIGIKYILSPERMGAPYTKVADIMWGQFYAGLYQNPYALDSVGFVLPCINEIDFGDGNNFSLCNELINNQIFGTSILSEIECYGQVEEGGITLYIPAESWPEGSLYFYLGSAETKKEDGRSARVLINGEEARPYIDGLQKNVIEIPHPSERTSEQYFEVRIENIKLEYYQYITLYRVDEAKTANALDELRRTAIKTIEYTNNGFKGKVSSPSGGMLLLTLPYEKGYTVYIDGEKVQTQRALNAFLSAKIEPGERTVEVKYVPYGFRFGCVLGTLGVLGEIILFHKKCKIK